MQLALTGRYHTRCPSIESWKAALPVEDEGPTDAPRRRSSHEESASTTTFAGVSPGS